MVHHAWSENGLASWSAAGQLGPQMKRVLPKRHRVVLTEEGLRSTNSHTFLRPETRKPSFKNGSILEI